MSGHDLATKPDTDHAESSHHDSHSPQHAHGRSSKRLAANTRAVQAQVAAGGVRYSNLGILYAASQAAHKHGSALALGNTAVNKLFAAAVGREQGGSMGGVRRRELYDEAVLELAPVIAAGTRHR